MTNYTVFHGPVRIASGTRPVAALAAKQAGEVDVLIFEDETGSQVDFDLSGSEAEMLARNAEPVAARGRPKLGVTAKEVTLLPRHWEWLRRQGGASATLRRLVNDGMKADGAKGRGGADAAYAFMNAIAGNLRGFEEATRALFAADADRFDRETADWPGDIRSHARKLAGDALA